MTSLVSCFLQGFFWKWGANNYHAMPVKIFPGYKQLFCMVFVVWSRTYRESQNNWKRRAGNGLNCRIPADKGQLICSIVSSPFSRLGSSTLNSCGVNHEPAYWLRAKFRLIFLPVNSDLKQWNTTLPEELYLGRIIVLWGRINMPYMNTEFKTVWWKKAVKSVGNLVACQDHLGSFSLWESATLCCLKIWVIYNRRRVAVWLVSNQRAGNGNAGLQLFPGYRHLIQYAICCAGAIIS